MFDFVLCFFFSSRRRHTRYWRDWSSDVCSSDLPASRLPGHAHAAGAGPISALSTSGGASARSGPSLAARIRASPLPRMSNDSADCPLLSRGQPAADMERLARPLAPLAEGRVADAGELALSLPFQDSPDHASRHARMPDRTAQLQEHSFVAAVHGEHDRQARGEPPREPRVHRLHRQAAVPVKRGLMVPVHDPIVAAFRAASRRRSTVRSDTPARLAISALVRCGLAASSASALADLAAADMAGLRAGLRARTGG